LHCLITGINHKGEGVARLDGKYNPSLKLCIAICKALGKTLDELFWEETP
jgi:putative transcriptional regulator